jgi:hypothetical protein
MYIHMLINKNICQCCKQIWTYCFSVVTNDIVSYYRFLNTDPGKYNTSLILVMLYVISKPIGGFMDVSVMFWILHPESKRS